MTNQWAAGTQILQSDSLMPTIIQWLHIWKKEPARVRMLTACQLSEISENDGQMQY